MFEIPIAGVDLFCPDCGRPLVTFDEEGGLTIHGEASVHGYLGGDITDDGLLEPPDEAFLVEAICLRRRCRTKRVIRTVGDGVKEKLAQTTTRRKR